jgi:hypothetical protein
MPDKESLSSSIRDYGKSHGRRVCGIQLALDKLIGVDKEDLNVALKDRSITNRSISLALADRDITVSIEMLKRHRRGDCSCES